MAFCQDDIFAEALREADPDFLEQFEPEFRILNEIGSCGCKEECRTSRKRSRDSPDPEFNNGQEAPEPPYEDVFELPESFKDEGNKVSDEEKQRVNSPQQAGDTGQSVSDQDIRFEQFLQHIDHYVEIIKKQKPETYKCCACDKHADFFSEKGLLSGLK